MGAMDTYDVSRRIDAVIEATRTDYWLGQEESRPNSWIGELPECPQALKIAQEGQASYRLNNFREKVERLGLWRKDTAGGQWVRESNPSGMPGVLDGVGDIAIRSSPGS